VVEGVIVEEGAVLSMACTSAEHAHLRRERDEVLYGRVPAGAVVVPARCRRQRQVQLYCA